MGNYRGVAILSTLPKLLERLVTKHLTSLFEQHLVMAQHGFRSGRSTCTNLVEFVSIVTRGMQNGDQIDVIYTDLSKAFDRVNHRLLIEKLRQLGINGPILGWITSYLSGRDQVVRVDSALSRPVSRLCTVKAGTIEFI